MLPALPARVQHRLCRTLENSPALRSCCPGATFAPSSETDHPPGSVSHSCGTVALGTRARMWRTSGRTLKMVALSPRNHCRTYWAAPAGARAAAKVLLCAQHTLLCNSNPLSFPPVPAGELSSGRPAGSCTCLLFILPSRLFLLRGRNLPPQWSCSLPHFHQMPASHTRPQRAFWKLRRPWGPGPGSMVPEEVVDYGT